MPERWTHPSGTVDTALGHGGLGMQVGGAGVGDIPDTVGNRVA
ncbi:hypothetical protein [Kibdelosporangium philippinense]